VAPTKVALAYFLDEASGKKADFAGNDFWASVNAREHLEGDNSRLAFERADKSDVFRGEGHLWGSLERDGDGESAKLEISGGSR
jgi:hypothetical protein